MTTCGLRWVKVFIPVPAFSSLLMNYKPNPVFGFIVVEGKICVACEKNGKSNEDREKGVGRQKI